MSWFYASPSLSTRELRAKVERAVARKSKSRGDLSPVRVEGRTIARSFWGQAWCRHIEGYSDYGTRLGRGRSYLYAGAVIDLKVGEGMITAQVMGSSLYQQTIEVALLPAKQRRELVQLTTGKIDSLVALLRGQLPPPLIAAMTDPTQGVFPSAGQLAMRCSCPDYASLCKHLAAVLYGLGARLDAAPELLFRLRGLAVEEMTQNAETTKLVREDIPAEKQASGDLAALFDIDLDDAPVAVPDPAPPRKTCVEREYLKVLGLPARTIDAWLRSGVLERTSQRDVYERTAEADARIAAFLAR